MSVPDPTPYRFLAISLTRIAGAMVAVLGLSLALGRLTWLEGETARIAGTVIAAIGFLTMIAVPRILVRRWRSPRP